MEPLLLVIPGCPNSGPSKELFDKALELEGITESVEVREVTTQAQADRYAFHGSPTFILEGKDLFASGAAPAMACRVYRTPDGLTGQPAFDDLRQAIRVALATGL